MIEQYIIARNRRYLNQAQFLLYKIKCLKILFSFGNNNLEGNAEHDKSLSLLFRSCTSKNFNSRNNHYKAWCKKIIVLNEMKYEFSKWKYSTTTSASSWHLDHYKEALVSDDEEQNDEIISFKMKCICYTTLLSMLPCLSVHYLRDRKNQLF